METKYVKTSRAELVKILVARDGVMCQFPDHSHELDFTAEGSQEVTIDHWYSQSYGKQNGWTTEQIWAPSNLKLMCRKGNSAKGDLIPNEDGTLPPKPMSRLVFRRQQRASRPELCEICDNGHNLFAGEFCANCGCNAQRFPRWAKVKAPDCSHDITWCWVCSITPDMRMGATEMIMFGNEGGSHE